MHLCKEILLDDLQFGESLLLLNFKEREQRSVMVQGTIYTVVYRILFLPAMTRSFDQQAKLTGVLSQDELLLENGCRSQWWLILQQSLKKPDAPEACGRSDLRRAFDRTP